MKKLLNFLFNTYYVNKLFYINGKLLNVVNLYRKIKNEIKVLEDELPKAQVLVFPMTGINPIEFEPQTLAVLRGRLVRYLMRSQEVSKIKCWKNVWFFDTYTF